MRAFIEKIQAAENVSFEDTMAIIAANYHYQPTEFSNGLAEDKLLNQPGVNEGSCKLFAFAKCQQFDQAQTLRLFGDYYRIDVLGNPTGGDHKNIRHFMKYGWQGIDFKGDALVAIQQPCA
ncbi:MAG: HopJ type III effector protein [Methylococcales bacterium]|nr:HopJ type III effector protein [Methylococcales bacterium]